ncbi:MAG: zf-HC2 domain-containing protein [Terracidiphilus sp.]
MAERRINPDSPACGQWEKLLAEALDGLLQPADESAFSTHMALCPACTELFEEARRGREWLEFLSVEPEVPAGLVEKILARTGPGMTQGQASDFGLAVNAGHAVAMPPAWQRPGFMGFIRRFAEPRLMMTAAMAFFSIAMTLNLTGVRLSDLRVSNLRPNMVRSFMERRLMTASTPIIRFYDHSRLAYEVEATMRQIRRSSEREAGEQPVQTPGVSRQTPWQNVTPRLEAPEQSGAPANGPEAEPAVNSIDSLQSSVRNDGRPAYSGDSREEVRERGTVWIA